jgi:hypothetical protein
MSADARVTEIVAGLHLSADQARHLTTYLRRDNPWQRRARLHQTIWGLDRGLDLDPKYPWWIRRSSLDADHVDTGNFLTDTVVAEVHRALSPQARERSRLISRDRLGRCLLSSQPLCFNAFGELSAPGRHRDATEVVRRLWPDLEGDVTDIRYEHSPHRGPAGPIGTFTAFDVFIDLATTSGRRGFVGIEVKYHEAMAERPPTDGDPTETGHQTRLDALDAAARRVGKSDRGAILSAPGWQVWLDHALAVAMLDPAVQARHDCFPDYSFGTFVMLSPSDNQAVRTTFQDYAVRIAESSETARTLRFCTLEDLVAACQEAMPTESWPSALAARYLPDT